MVVTFKPSPPKSGRRGPKRQSPFEDELRATSDNLLMHGRAAGDRPVPPLAEGSMQELRWKGRGKQDQAKRSGKAPIAKWELRKLDTWQPSGPDPNKVKDPQGKGVFSAFDPKGGAARETGMALPGARDTYRPVHGRRAAAPQQVAEQPVWSPNRFFPEGLHQLKGADRAPHPFNLTTEYRDTEMELPSQAERKQRESRLNALRVMRSKINQELRMNGISIRDVESMFQAMDRDGSGTMDYDEFTDGLKRLGIVFGSQQLAAVIEALDANGDGEITIKEFLDQCDDRFRAEGALGDLDAEVHERLGSSAPKVTKKEKLLPNSSVFGLTMNLTVAADIALRNRYTRAGGASRFRLSAKKEEQPVSPAAAAAIDRIFAFIKKEQLKVIDMFFKIDVDRSGEIEPAEFVQALSKMGLKLSPEELEAVVHELDVDGDGTVELHEFMHQMKRISRARFSQSQQDGRLNFARKGSGWVIGSEGVPWLQPPEFGPKIGMAGKVGRTQAHTRVGMRSKFEPQPKYFTTQHEKFRKAATSTGQLRSSRRQGTQLGVQTARGPPLMLPPSALDSAGSGSQSAR